MNAITTSKGGSKLSSLEAIERARAFIADATDFEDVAEMADIGAAALAYEERKKAGEKTHAAVWALCQEAQRRLGELTRSMPKARAGRKPTVSNLPPGGEILSPPPKIETLASLGIPSQRVSKAERMAAIEPDEFRARVKQGQDDIEHGKRPKDITAVTASTTHNSDEYGTPENYAESARVVLGGIDLDVASNAAAQNVIKAKRFITKEENALMLPWEARSFWMNPPFSRGKIDGFVDKLLLELDAKRLDTGIVLTNCDPSAAWFQSLLGACDCFCLPGERISFLLDNEPVRGNFFAQTIFYFGRDLNAFGREFKKFGTVCMRFGGML